ncbi:hypothetical protein [Bradyrhizobium lablabi]|uniref:hypothetical protein n=1 Tax=Bradyrhizobium lablabi TaxID=722472 RepID=UPI001BA6DD78|nr:hypothetical protein [Bradyrhizobium lablabi]MBR0693411.1 hypothetical protein [Bradyrhizobium lablabi]
MAKDRDNLAADFEREAGGGLLNGFLAEEDAFDRRALWRLGSWGVAAVAAVTIAVVANQSYLTLKRDQVAAADIARQAQQMQVLAKESRTEVRRLASAIDTLSSDRDRLYSRVSSLEQGLDSVTGAITRQAPATAAASPKPVTTPADPPATAPAPAPASPPAAAPMAATPQPASDKPTAPEKPSTADKPVALADKPAVVSTDKPPATGEKPVVSAGPAAPDTAPAAGLSTARDAAKTAAALPSHSLAAAKPIVAPPDSTAGKLIEPAKAAITKDVSASPIPDVAAASAPAAEVDVGAAAPQAQIQRTEFGVDLGTANSVNGLRALWRGLLKSKANAPLTALRPIIVIKEATNGPGMQLRLVAGPLNDAGTAAKICAGLSLNQRPCETAIYDGQRLTMQADEPPPAASKPPQHRRVYPKRAAAPPAVEEPKKPEPSTFSSLFGRNSQ